MNFINDFIQEGLNGLSTDSIKVYLVQLFLCAVVALVLWCCRWMLLWRAHRVLCSVFGFVCVVCVVLRRGWVRSYVFRKVLTN